MAYYFYLDKGENMKKYFQVRIHRNYGEQKLILLQGYCKKYGTFSKTKEK